MCETIPSAFISSAAKYRDKCLFRFFNGSWRTMSYHDFFSLTGNYLTLLTENGVHKGDRIAILAENRPEWCASYMAAVGCGGIAVPIDVQLGAGEIRNLLQDSGAKLVFCSNKTSGNLSGIIKETGMEAINIDAHGFLSARSSNPAVFHASVSPSDIASIIYTSGTTGKPKGVMLSHRNFFSDAEALINMNIVSHVDNILAILPLHHTYPFMCTFLLPLFLGATITFGPGLKAPELLSAIKENSVTVL